MTFYVNVTNPTTLVKPSALQQLHTELIQFNIEIAIVAIILINLLKTTDIYCYAKIVFERKVAGFACTCEMILNVPLCHSILKICENILKVYGVNAGLV